MPRIAAALGFTRLQRREPATPAALALAHRMDSWAGLGAVLVGMTAQGFNVGLKELPNGWRENF